MKGDMMEQYIQQLTNNIHTKVKELNSILKQAVRANMSIALGIDTERECLVTIGTITHRKVYQKTEE